MAYFTVCIPAYNREYTLKRCLDSLCNQTMKDFEVVFVDDENQISRCTNYERHGRLEDM